jgi:hypothetical protein
MSGTPHEASSTHVFQAISRGWRIFPVKFREKLPLVKGWPNLATADKAKISEWLRQYGQCNWGLATGSASGILVLDADSDEALNELEKLGSPQTFTVKTARGQHFYFQYPSDSTIHNSASKLAKGLDVRGEGGYVLMPPSVHPSGVRYQILDNRLPVPPPQWLLKKLTGPPASSSKVQVEGNPTLVEQKIGEGSRNATLASLAGTMQRRGMTQGAIEAALIKENEQRCNPPLPPDEVLAIVNSISRYEPADEKGQQSALVIGERPFAQMVPAAESVLKNSVEERIYQTPLSRRLIRIVQHKQDPQPDKGVNRDPEASLLVDIDARYLQLALGRSGQVVRQKGNGLIAIDAPRQLAEMILSSVKASPEFTSWNRLKKISVTPVLLSNGTIVTEPGYHPQTQIWIDTRGIDFVDPALDKPNMSRRECRRLIEAFIHPIVCEYPFLKEKTGQHWYETGAFSVVLSALMSIDDRHNLSAVPMHCVSAPTQSCGKTRLVQAISAAVTGGQPTIVTYDGAEEFGKHIPVLLGKGDPVICVDNVIMPVNNARLAALLTQEYLFTYRVLGASEERTVENLSVLCATGVNLQLSGDMPTRCLLVRIEPEDERPELKKFPFDQVERAKEFFPHAVMAVKAVLRAHQLAGFPGEKLLKGASRFRVWDKRVRAAIVWLGYADPTITQEAIRADDPIRNENVRLLWMLRRKFGETPFLVAKLASIQEAEDIEALKQITGHKEFENLNERKIGKYFSHHLSRNWFEGIRLVRTGKTPGGRIEWRIEAKPDAAPFGGKEEAL